jgi:hypothetical protein
MSDSRKPGTTTVRLPAALHAELKDAAERAGHSMNTEIVARLSSSRVTLHDLALQNQQTQAMVQQIIDALRPRR